MNSPVAVRAGCSRIGTDGRFSASPFCAFVLDFDLRCLRDYTYKGKH